MKVIGVTGGVGAGKSRVLKYLEEACGAYVIQADQVGHKVMEPGEAAYEAVLETFGGDMADAGSRGEKNILRPDGTIDRSVLGTLVFTDRDRLMALNAIIHPAVKEWIRRELEIQRRQGRAICVVEAALLIEDHYEEFCGELWYIYAEETVRRQRLQDSRGYSQEKITSIFQNQLSEEEFRRHCQVVIENSGEFEEARRQIAAALDGRLQGREGLGGRTRHKDRRAVMDGNTMLWQWTREPEHYTITDERVEIITRPYTDLWQRTYYHFRNDNAPVLQMYTDEKYFSFVVKTEFESKRRYDQCGVVMYLDSENWLKASVEYENEEIQRLGSVVTNYGYSDWASTDVDAAMKTMWFRFSRRENDFCVENSVDGIHFSQMRICHMFQAGEGISFGIYACSPEDSSFKASFTNMEITDCKWAAHVGQAPDEEG